MEISAGEDMASQQPIGSIRQVHTIPVDVAVWVHARKCCQILPMHMAAGAALHSVVVVVLPAHSTTGTSRVLEPYFFFFWFWLMKSQTIQLVSVEL